MTIKDLLSSIVSVESLNKSFETLLKHKKEKEKEKETIALESLFGLFKSKPKNEPELSKTKSLLSEYDFESYLNNVEELLNDKKQIIKHANQDSFSLKIKGFGNVQNSADFLKAIEYQNTLLNIVDKLNKDLSKNLVKFKTDEKNFSNDTAYNKFIEDNNNIIIKTLTTVLVKDNQLKLYFDKYGVIKLKPPTINKSDHLTSTVFSYVDINIREIVFTKNEYLKIISNLLNLQNNLLKFTMLWSSEGSHDGMFDDILHYVRTTTGNKKIVYTKIFGLVEFISYNAENLIYSYFSLFNNFLIHNDDNLNSSE